MKADDVSCHDASDKVIRQDVVSFSKLGSRELGTFDHCFIITENISFIIDRDPKVSKIISEFNYLLKACSPGDKFCAIRRTFNCMRFLTISFNRKSIEVMDDTGN